MLNIIILIYCVECDVICPKILYCIKTNVEERTIMNDVLYIVMPAYNEEKISKLQ